VQEIAFYSLLTQTSTVPRRFPLQQSNKKGVRSAFRAISRIRLATGSTVLTLKAIYELENSQAVALDSQLSESSAAPRRIPLKQSNKKRVKKRFQSDCAQQTRNREHSTYPELHPVEVAHSRSRTWKTAHETPHNAQSRLEPTHSAQRRLEPTHNAQRRLEPTHNVQRRLEPTHNAHSMHYTKLALKLALQAPSAEVGSSVGAAQLKVRAATP
jgi:hypothetical protein